ncbi:hypothetical protein WMY93_027830 [Mugilogobius chulae]|uniref:Solute carrier organic anion transporter family member n=1 Tax=Mugilogobius chulae TaxID=88201 RepID=A0AAW0MYD8_9GOBI
MPDLLQTDVSFTSRQELLDLQDKPPDEDVGVDSQSHSPNGSAPRSPSSLGADVSAHSAVSTGATSFQGQFCEPDPAQCGHSVMEQDSELLCGWGSLRPKALQVFNTPGWFLFFLSVAGFLQGLVINGFVNTVVTTLERRFDLSSSQTGLIISSYDIASCVGLPFVSYFGGNGHKPRWLGCGFIIMGLGSFIFALPHFTTPPYQVTTAPEKSHLCLANSTDFSQNKAADGLSNYYYVFVLGQLLHGLGAAPLLTLGFTFLDENVKETNAPVFMGVLYTAMTLSPAVGMLLGGYFLGLHTDLIQTSKITPQSPLWVGAWWIGFLLVGTLCLPVGFAILSYPRKLPGSQETTATCEAPQDKEKSHTTASDPEFGQTLRDMPKTLLLLCSNLTFIFLCLAISSLAGMSAALSAFTFKFLQSQFRFSAAQSALIFGAVVPTAGLGTFIGSYIVKRFKLQVRGMIRFCIGCAVTGLFLSLMYFISCPTVPLAGVTVPYTSGQMDESELDPRLYKSLQQLHSSSLDDRLTAQCNSNCSCDKQKFSPVCGADDVMYFSPCYAGCSSINTTAGGEVFSGCSCVVVNVSSGREGLAVAGQCEGSCSTETAAFLSLLTILALFDTFIYVPPITATLRCVTVLCLCRCVTVLCLCRCVTVLCLCRCVTVLCLCRCVTESQKSFALGIQWILVRTLGAIPAPIVFGALMDQACLLRPNEDQGSCFLYENSKMSYFSLIISVIYRVVGTFFYILALVFHQRSARPQLQQNSEHTQGGATVEQQQTRL